MMDRRALGLFPWENFGGGDEKAPLTWWQKLYWVVFRCAPLRADAAHSSRRAAPTQRGLP